MSNDVLPKKPIVQVPITVYFFDTDAGGVVHNIAYLRMIETARSDLAQSLGWSLKEMTEQDCPVIARTEIDYLKPALLGDNLIVESEITKMEKIRFYITTTIKRGDEVLTKCVQTLFTVDLKSKRPQALRKEWLEKWPELVD
jgi:YbgC/YbaW family acyl-CoA thioester hydrolase